MVIYADEVFLINLAVNYLVLLAGAKLCGISGRRWRMALGAALGGAYAVSAIISPFLQHPAVKVSVGILMTVIAFGEHKRIFRIILTVFGVSAAFAGVIYALSLMTGADYAGRGFVSVSFKMLVLSFGVCYLIVDIVFKRLARATSEIVRVAVVYRGRKAETDALMDTGHSLKDPLSGDQVIIIGAEALSPLFDRDTAWIMTLPPADAVERLVKTGHRFRLITYSAVGVESGMLAAFRPDRVIIKGREVRNCIIAISPNSVSDGGAYSALIGADYD
jgi:stage II sporulation protein GA (sporulation sigma-E factor processing peptidase)